MKYLLLSFVLVLCAACSRFDDQRIELSNIDNEMTAPPCACKIQAKNVALEEDKIYTK